MDKSQDPGLRVLIVEPDADEAAALARDLGALGRQAIAARTALEAISWLEAPEASIVALIVNADLQWLDGLTGVSLLGCIAVDYPDVRRVLACRDEWDWRAAVVAMGDADALLPMPWSRRSLRRAIAGNSSA